VKKTGPEGLEILLRKDFVAGDPIVRLEGAMISRFAELLSRLHSRGVVMCDPNLENFVQDESGEIHCIDYGRAATFALRSPFFYYSIGSEFAKCIHEAFDDDEDRWADFLKAYFDASSAGGFSRWMIDGSFRFAVKSRARRNERR
jgi:tRNA A-37 threonylcarbamoyl transferase component Bud32